MFNTNQPPRISGRKDPVPNKIKPVSDTPLTKELLDELKEVVNDTFMICQGFTDETTGRAALQYLMKLCQTERFYCMFTGKVEPTLLFEQHLFDETHGANDAKLDWLFRYSSFLFAHWSGTDQYYGALLDRLAFALSSEVTLDTRAEYDQTMLSPAYLERMESQEQVRSVLDQNRILVTIACFIFYADHIKLINLLQPEGDKRAK